MANLNYSTFFNPSSSRDVCRRIIRDARKEVEKIIYVAPKVKGDYTTELFIYVNKMPLFKIIDRPYCDFTFDSVMEKHIPVDKKSARILLESLREQYWNANRKEIINRLMSR